MVLHLWSRHLLPGCITLHHHHPVTSGPPSRPQQNDLHHRLRLALRILSSATGRRQHLLPQSSSRTKSLSPGAPTSSLPRLQVAAACSTAISRNSVRASLDAAGTTASSGSGSFSFSFFFEGNAMLFRHPESSSTAMVLSKRPSSPAASGQIVRVSRLVARHNLVFQLAQGAEQFAGFKRFDDEAVGADALGFFRLERLQFAHRQQDWNPRRFPLLPSAAGTLQARCSRAYKHPARSDPGLCSPIFFSAAEPLLTVITSYPASARISAPCSERLRCHRRAVSS